MGRDQLKYNRRRASDHYFNGVDELMEVESSYCHEVLAWERRVGVLESKVSAAVDAETHPRTRNIELAVFLTDEDTRRSRIADGRACVVASMNGLGTDVQTIFVRMEDMMEKLWLDLTALIWVGPRAACGELINLVAADFTAASSDNSAAPRAGSVPAGEAAHLRGNTVTDLDVVASGFVPLPAKRGNANDIAKAVAELIGDMDPSHPSASHDVNFPFLTRSDDDRH